MIKIFTEKSSEILKADYIKEYNLLSDFEKAKDDISIAAHLFLRRKISELYNIEKFDFSYNENGKPNLDFCSVSISHSDDLIAVAISEREVGIDIEKIKKIKKRPKYKLFSENENTYINNSSQPDIDFLRVWTMKEAYIKAKGFRLSDALSFDVFTLKDAVFNTEIEDDFVLSTALLL